MINILSAGNYNVAVRVWNYSESEERYAALLALGFVKVGWI